MVLRIESFVKTALWAILALSASAACLEAALLLREARFRLDAMAGQVEGLVRPTQAIEANWSAVAVTSAQVLAKERNAFDSQQSYFEQLKSATAELSMRANAVLDDTDVAVRATNADLDEVAVTVHGADLAIANDSSAAASILQAVQGSFGKVDSVTLPIAESMQKLNATMTQVQAVSEDSRKVADHYTALILAPASKVKGAILFAASIAGRVLRIF